MFGVSTNPRNIMKLAAILLLLLVVIGGYFGYKTYQEVYAPNVELTTDKVAVYIPTGSDYDDVVEMLDTSGYLKDIESFKWLAFKKNLQGSNIVPGKYTLKNGMGNNALINHLRAGNGREDVKVIFNLIRTKEQLAGQISKQIEPDSLEIYEWLTNPDSVSKYGFDEYTITALFIPNTYYLNWSTSTPQLMKRMGKEFKDFWNADRLAKARAAGLSQSEVVTLASIVYWETKKPKDMPTVAGVYMNRLKVGMPLQADPTLIFALGDFEAKRVLNKDKLIDSPYNTYLYKGLPPGPILIPPTSYVDAVLNYEKHGYYYFVAKEDFSGDSYFSKNYQQHLIYARKYQKALDAQGVYR